ncbi:peptidase M76 family-domain-containing protein [Hypoxylon fragiforme]|uniref:peptidase M76 family-domain-containing protein n=1 Tax=Hypoxylon fragiforme TaxID=63214 RepID=UPI0020C6C49A|nr:peptidase M76 family-domain-containing protein [Hypoxylon fragiforme]KAI2612905.1 peptidase M76 family-domain-containing protein [Hypoxylon fragiforme]
MSSQPSQPGAPGAPTSNANPQSTPSSSASPTNLSQQQQQQQQQQPQSPPSFPEIVKNDPKRTGFDPATSEWINYFKAITNTMTPEGKFHYRETIAREKEAALCARCEDLRDWAFAHSPTVIFLRQKIAALNGSLDRSNVFCRRCPARLTEDGAVHRASGGFSPGSGILICADVIKDQAHMEDTLSHEMVHAWDHLRWKVDWNGEKGLKHAACTEIRASMLSGECRWAKEAWTRGNWSLTQQFQECVRRRAVQSVMARPWCKDDVEAVKVVNQVWDSCFSDTRPFDEVYR